MQTDGLPRGCSKPKSGCRRKQLGHMCQRHFLCRRRCRYWHVLTTDSRCYISTSGTPIEKVRHLLWKRRPPWPCTCGGACRGDNHRLAEVGQFVQSPVTGSISSVQAAGARHLQADMLVHKYEVI